MFQESLWHADYEFVSEDGGNEGEEREWDMMLVACAAYTKLVFVLKRKVVWMELNSWPRGEFTLRSMSADADFGMNLKTSEPVLQAICL